MGNSLLHKSRAGNFGIDDFIHVVAGRVDNILDDIRIKIEMLQIKELIIVLIGIPTFIYTFFLDIKTDVEMWKGIVLTSILAVTGIIAAARQLVKFLKELRELREKD
jgi:hypothetical protein